jgi:hypothetical protein
MLQVPKTPAAAVLVVAAYIGYSRSTLARFVAIPRQALKVSLYTEVM